MLPYLGAGIGQGLEDVYVLSELLKSPKSWRPSLRSVSMILSQVRQSNHSIQSVLQLRSEYVSSAKQ